MRDKTRNKGKAFVQNVLCPMVYNLNRTKPVDKRLVVFADAHTETMPEHMRPLYEKLYRRGFLLKTWFFDTAKLTYPELVRHMTAFMKLYATAGTVVICDSFLPAASCKKKKQTRVVQLWHAAGALKRFGYDAPLDIPPDYRGNVFQNYDLCAVSSPYCASVYQKAMHLPDGVCRPLGTTLTDCFFDLSFQKACRDKFRYFHPDATGKKVVLWCPTFRGSARHAGELPADRLPGVEEINRLSQLSPYYVVRSPHGHMLPDRRVDMTSVELMFAADVLLADYSSLIFSFMLTGKPICYFAPDYAAYEAERGFYLDYGSLPGIHANRYGDLQTAVDAALTDKPDYGKVLSVYMSACDGHASDRICDYIEGGTL